jgi:hypothetical protein
MAMIEYVGKKAMRADTVAGTKIVWYGAGDVQEVPDLAVPKLLKHPDVWVITKGKKQPEPQAVEAPQADDSIPTAEEKPVTGHIIETPDGKQHVLDGMERDELRALAKTYNIPTGNSGADKIRERLTEAFPKG